MDKIVFSELIIEAGGDISAQFQVLFLVFSDGNVISPINQNVRRLQNGVHKQTRRDKRLIVFCLNLVAFVLELRHFLQLAIRRCATQNPTQFRMFGNERLYEQIFSFDAASEQLKRHFPSIIAQIRRFVRRSHRVIIDNAVEATVLRLQIDPILHCAKVIAEVQIARRLYARKHSFHSKKKIESLEKQAPQYKSPFFDKMFKIS